MTGIFTNSPLNPVPFFIYPGTKGEKLKNGTVIHIEFTADVNLHISEVGILNADSNVKKILVSFKDEQGYFVFGNDSMPLVSTNYNATSIVVTGEQLPSQHVREIIVQIADLVEINISTRVTLTVKGCFVNRKKHLYKLDAHLSIEN